MFRPDGAPFQTTSLPGVHHLRITTFLDHPHDGISESIKKSVFRVLHFPDARDLTITFLGVPLQLASSEPAPFILFEELDALFSYSALTERSAFPRVSRLVINVFPTEQMFDREKVGFGVGVAVLVLPLHLFPAVKDLRIESRAFLNIGKYGLDKEEFVQPTLRRIELDVPRLSSSTLLRSEPPLADWFRALARRLLAQGVWDEFEELVLTERIQSVNSSGENIKRRIVESVLSRELVLTEGGGVFDEDV